MDSIFAQFVQLLKDRTAEAGITFWSLMQIDRARGNGNHARHDFFPTHCLHGWRLKLVNHQKPLYSTRNSKRRRNEKVS